jgi:hypothetical protein
LGNVKKTHILSKNYCEVISGKVHLICCKHLLGTKKTSSNIGVKAELGRFPVENFINSQAILYLARLHTDNLNLLLKEAFELSKSLDSQGVSNNHEAYTNKNTLCLYEIS